MVSQISVPFKNTDNGIGLMENTGQIIFHGDRFIIEFEKKDAILGLYQTTIETIEVPLESVNSLELKKNWFSTRLTLTARKIKAIEELPGRNGREWTVSIPKKDREEAARMVSETRLQLSELLLRQLDSGSEDE